MKPVSKPKPVPRISKKMVCIRLDKDVLEWYKSGGPGYQTWIQEILRDYKERHESRAVRENCPVNIRIS